MAEWFDKYGLTEKQKREIPLFGIWDPDEAINGAQIPEDVRELHELMRDAECLMVLNVLRRGMEPGNIVADQFVVHWAVAEKFEKLFVEWFKMGFRLEAVVPAVICNYDDQELMAGNYSSGYRPEWGVGRRTVSEHTKAAAGDFNPVFNPDVKIKDGIPTYNPRGARHHPSLPGTLYEGSNAVTAIRDCGLAWGGGFGDPDAPEYYSPGSVDAHFDYMHVELLPVDSKALDKHLPPQLRGM